ncbi:MAG: glycosyltransferase family 1 protein [Chitinophagaceae bacterium]|nr:MAG: glycosyltransferase family 1 protein [Chitinophagaceae bacterium]
MRIAFISYEFPPDTAFGGIATYTYHMALSLKNLGCDVEVFTASHRRESRNEGFEGLLIHRIHTTQREAFRQAIVAVVAERHREKNFDLMESPEYGTEGALVKEALPAIPLVVKFHTPSFVVKDFNRQLKAHQLKYKFKNFFGIGSYRKEADPEYQFAIGAEALAAPSESMAAIISEKWQIAKERIAVLPSPFLPQQALLQIPPGTETNTVTYLGRLEGRKGVHLLAKAIPLVLQKKPDTLFRFIGKTNIGPNGKGTMLGYLEEQLQTWLHRVEFIDQVPPQEVPLWLQKSDVCVFPSLWEAFGYVCVEAMSAARAVVASKYGGMNDMLADIDQQLLVNPENTTELAAAILSLLEQPQKRIAIGMRSREKVINYYGLEAPKRNLKFYQEVAEAFRAKKN